MNLGVQYYRAPFPDEKYWEEDFRKIRESGYLLGDLHETILSFGQ